MSCAVDTPGEYTLNLTYKGKKIFKQDLKTNIISDFELPRKMAFIIQVFLFHSNIISE